MKPTLTVYRYPNKSTLMRGPNMITKFCNKCTEDKTHGFWFYDTTIMNQAIFVCDDCFKMAKKEVRS